MARTKTVKLTECELGDIGAALLVLWASETTMPSKKREIEKLMKKLADISLGTIEE